MSLQTLTLVLHGPESTGKSTLGETLARRLGGLYVPEYGRTYCEIHGNSCDEQDLLNIAQGQQDAIARAVQTGARLVIADTDAVLTDVWAEMMLGCSLFAGQPPVSGDFYLLTDIDVPFVDEPVRVYGAADARQMFFDKSQAILTRLGLAHVRLSGSWEARQAQAVDAICARYPQLSAFG